MNTELIKEIKNWIKDYEATQPKNVIVDPKDDQTFEGSAYWLFKSVLAEARKKQTMAVSNFKELKQHIGHEVEVVSYNNEYQAIENVAIECNDCSEVLLDYDNDGE